MFGLDLFQLLVIGVIALSLVIILGSGISGLKLGFFLFIITLGLGYRTVDLAGLTVHPSELLIWMLLIILLFQRRRWFPEGLKTWVPRWALALVPFWALAAILGYGSGRAWVQMLQEAKNFLVIVPMAIVAWAVLQDRENWKPVVVIFFITGTWIGAVGLLEYTFPGFVGAIPGFASNPEALVTLEGFRRATFSFYGAPVATFTLALSLPMAHVVWDWCREFARGSLSTEALAGPEEPAEQKDVTRKTNIMRLLVLAGAAVQIMGIYIGGYRSIWFVIILAVVVWGFYRFGSVAGVIFLLISIPGLAVLVPLVAEERFVSLFLALEGGQADSSAQGRLLRIEEAWARTLERPWGSGWAGSGWVHNDFLQISVGQGLLTALLVAGIWLVNNIQLVRHIFNTRQSGLKARLPEALSLALLISGGVMITQGTTWLIQLAMPIWLVWILASAWLYQNADVVYAYQSNRSNFQQSPWVPSKLPQSPSSSPPSTTHTPSAKP